jgi:hemolysin activation/secretion protein
MKNIIFTILLTFFSIAAFAQADSTKSNSIKPNSVNLEVMGTGIGYSFNYERLIRIDKNSFVAASLGYEYSDGSYFIPTIGIVNGNTNAFEIGYGFAYSRDKEILHSIRIGYRYLTDSYYLRFAFTPILNISLFDYKGPLPWIGICIGICI